MKLKAVKIETYASSERRPIVAFTIIETIGVLAAIALLAAVALPTITEALEKARVANLVSGYLALKTAISNHVNQYKSFNYLNGTVSNGLPIENYDTVILVPEGFLNQKFRPNLGGPNANVRLVTGPNSNSGFGYWFLGVTNHTPTACTLNFGFVIECVITNLTYLEAGSTAVILDQAQFTPAFDGFLDTAGKMDYNPTNGGTLHMYLLGE